MEVLRRRGICLAFMVLIAVTILAQTCGFTTVRVRRDLDTTGYEVQAFYLSGGGRVENQGVQIVDSTGSRLGQLGF